MGYVFRSILILTVLLSTAVKAEGVKVKSLNNYMDSKLFIGHGYPGTLEFGDGAQRLGTFWIKTLIMMSDHEETKHKSALVFESQLELMHLDTGEWVRHWDHSQWPGQPGIMSRDQMDPLLMAMILWAPYNSRIEELAKETVLSIIKRGGFLWNVKSIWPKPEDKPKLITDWFGVSILGYAIRLWQIKPLYILLPIIDLPQILNSILRCVIGYFNRNEVGDDLNHQVRLVFSQLKVPTFVTKIAKFIYKKFRPKPALEDGTIIEGNPVKTTWQVYYNGEANPPLDVEWELVQDRYL